MAQILLHEGQSEIYNSLFVKKTCLHAVAVCARGFGKSYLAAAAASTAVMELLEMATAVPNKNVYIIAPTYDQVKDIYFPLLAYEFGLEEYAIRSSRDLGRFWFPRGVELRLISFEAIARMRGKGAYFVVNDEVRDWTKGDGLKDAWESVIQPCISTRWSRKRAKAVFSKSPGRSLTISTPNAYDYLYDMYNRREIDSDWQSFHFDYTQSPYLDAEELAKIQASVDPMTWIREYLARFEGSGKSVFYCFDRKLHVASIQEQNDFKSAKDEVINVAIDFNVGIQASSAFVIRGNQVIFFDEFKGHPDTETLAIAIKGRFPGHKIRVFPDPSGKSRKTSATVGVTDFSILRSAGFTVLAHEAAPKIVDSVACVNRMLKTATGIVSVKVLPRCTGIIKSLERTAWVDNNSDTATIDKTAGVEHFSDGIRYAIEYLFPIRLGTKVVSKTKRLV
jgi:hypothetical protein